MNDIEILEDFVKGKIEPDKLENYEGGYKLGFFYTKDLQQAIENLIKENKELKVKNKELKDRCIELVTTIDALKTDYEEEKEKIVELEEYAKWHISHLTEDIKDYIDDDRKGNASLIGELKEEREHWRDIIRIIKNEETYINYQNY